jgi:phosphoribosylformylglycinamidine (FGAM) synthase-like enzyme
MLFGESLGRILVSVKAEQSAEFESAMVSNACFRLGEVGVGDEISISLSGETILQASMSALKQSWQATLDGGGA